MFGLWLVTGVLGVVAEPTQAAFPGENGKIAFSSYVRGSYNASGYTP
jgi:hypothetical protein